LQAALLGFGVADCQHFRRVVYAINDDPSSQVIQQQAPRAATHLQGRLAVPADEFAKKKSILPTRFITQEKVPG
jgi:hypothetical protein